MTSYATAIVLPDNAKTYELYSTISNTSGALGVVAAALVTRDESGVVKVAEGDDTELGAGTVGGSLVGMIIGVLGGPLGVLLGGATGGAAGALFDVARADDVDDAITEFSRLVPVGGNAIIAETDEVSTAALDAVVTQAGGTIYRRPLAEVVAELEAQQQAAEDAARAARAAMREQRKQERHEKVHERIDALKARFHHDK